MLLLALLHPQDERFCLAWTATGAGHEVHGNLARRRERQGVAVSGSLEHHVVERQQEPHIGTNLHRLQFQERRRRNGKKKANTFTYTMCSLAMNIVI